ncbi:DUF2240 family protein [Candidatus Woesearchaeota archaeon]|nr:DUF2240 family protein [Candidatus Woesearchaeota archaeon]
MINIPYDEIIEKITSESNMSKEDVEKKIKDKMDQLSGLISKEGAAHIVANELNIKLFDVEKANSELKIKEVFPGLRNISVVGKVTRSFGIREFQVQDRSGKVGNMLIGDETGIIKIVMWGSVADELNKIKEDDVVKISSGYSKENNGFKEIHLNEKSKVEINPEGIEITEVKKSSFGEKAPRKEIKDLTEADTRVEIMGTLVDLFDIRFFEVCSECNKRVKQESEFKCAEHPDKEHTFSYVLNGFLDDGTDNIRLVFFRNRIEELLKKSNEEILKIKDNPESFADIKSELLGSIVKVTGRVVKNEMFERKEFIVNLVEDPKAEEEIERVKNS